MVGGPHKKGGVPSLYEIVPYGTSYKYKDDNTVRLPADAPVFDNNKNLFQGSPEMDTTYYTYMAPEDATSKAHEVIRAQIIKTIRNKWKNKPNYDYNNAINNVTNMTVGTLDDFDKIIKSELEKCVKPGSKINIYTETNIGTLIDNIIISDNDDGNYDQLKYTKIPAGTYFYRRQKDRTWHTGNKLHPENPDGRLWFDYLSKHTKVTDTPDTFLKGELWNYYLYRKIRGQTLTLYKLKQDVIVLHFPFNVNKKLTLNFCARYEQFTVMWFLISQHKWAIHGYTADFLTYATKDCMYKPNHRELCLLPDVNNEQYLEFIGVCDKNGTLKSSALWKQIRKDGYKTIDIGTTPYIVSDIHGNQLTIDTDCKDQQLLITNPHEKDIKEIVEEQWTLDSAADHVRNPLLNSKDNINVKDTSTKQTVTGKIHITKDHSLRFVTNKPKE